MIADARDFPAAHAGDTTDDAGYFRGFGPGLYDMSHALLVAHGQRDESPYAIRSTATTKRYRPASCRAGRTGQRILIAA